MKIKAISVEKFTVYPVQHIMTLLTMQGGLLS